MKLIRAGVVVMLAALLWQGLPREDPIDPVVVSAVEAASLPGDSFSLLVGGRDAGCVVSAAGQWHDPRGRALRLAPACRTGVPALAEARWWREQPDGTVAFTRGDGEVLAEFAIADGAAYETFAPGAPVLTLLAL